MCAARARLDKVCSNAVSTSLEIVHNYLRPKRLALFNEFQMLGMILIIVLRPLRIKTDVQSNLVTLIDDTAMATHHFADVEVQNAGNRGEVFFCVSDHFIGSARIGRGPSKKSQRAKTFARLMSDFPGWRNLEMDRHMGAPTATECISCRDIRSRPAGVRGYSYAAGELSTASARTEAAVRVSTSSLPKISRTYFFTVDSLLRRMAAISPFVLP